MLSQKQLAKSRMRHNFLKQAHTRLENKPSLQVDQPYSDEEAHVGGKGGDARFGLLSCEGSVKMNVK